MTAKLTIRIDEPKGSSNVTTLERSPAVIGRDEPAAIRLEDALVSRAHAEIAWDDETVTVRDLGSSNGTFVDGSRVTSARVSPGSSIRVGGTTLTLVGLRAESPGIVLDRPSDAQPSKSNLVVYGVAAALVLIFGMMLLSGGGPLGGGGGVASIAGILGIGPSAPATPTPEQVAAQGQQQLQQELASIPATAQPGDPGPNGEPLAESEVLFANMSRDASTTVIGTRTDPKDPSIVIVTYQMSGGGMDGTITWEESFQTKVGSSAHVPQGQALKKGVISDHPTSR
jgi:pSer/pThr/pTyr-binding forkhead associated (FHA) protein